MSRTEYRLGPLEVRKQLLLVESELNRAQLANECAALGDHCRGLSGEFAPLIASITTLVSGVKAVKDLWSERRGTRGSMFATLVGAVRTGVSAWSALRGRSR